MEDERLIFMRKLLALCKEHGVDLMGEESSIAVFRGEKQWIDDLAFVFHGERGSGVVEAKLGGYWGGEHHEVTA